MNDLLSALLGQAESNWGMDEAAIQDAMAKIAFHESKYGTPEYTPMQISDESSSGYGPGRGLYQYDIGEKEGALTAINRLISINESRVNQYDISFLDSMIKNKSYDFSQLTPEQQNMLFLADKLVDKTANMGRYDTDGDKVLSNEELAGFHADEHYAGYGNAQDVIYELMGGQGPTDTPLPILSQSDIDRQSFIDKIIKDYQAYKP